MGVAPDRDSATRDEEKLAHLVHGCLARALPSATVPAPREMVYPGFHAAVRHIQRMVRQGEPGPRAAAELAAGVRAVAERASRSASRGAERTWHPQWAVDLAPAEEHLTASLRRAMGQLPNVAATQSISR